MKTISSQRYTNNEIVSAKIERDDFDVLVSPVFTLDGQDYRVVLDGHHALAAAKSAGVNPVFIEADEQSNDNVALLKNGEIEDFLVVTHMGDDYFDVETMKDIW